MPKPLCMWRAFLSQHGPGSHNTQYKRLRPDWLPQCRDFIQSKLPSLLRVHLSCAYTQTQTKTLTHKDSPLNPCDVMGAGVEIQEVINNRLFSLEKKQQLSHGAVGTCEIHQSIPSTFNTSWAIHHFSHDCQSVSLSLSYSPSPISTFPSSFSHTSFLVPYKFKILREFSPVMNTSRVFICESFLWSLSWPGGLAAELVFLWAFSQRRPRHDCYSEREAGSGTAERGVWSGHGRNGTVSTFHTSLGVTANFLYCTFDWKHIWNIFSWSHLQCKKRKKS